MNYPDVGSTDAAKFFFDGVLGSKSKLYSCTVRILV
jgi:hypothetical protein